ncbi:hypothetical protein K8I85_09540 [bacterium]|nr:hypothetical protein [bacterium]
MGASRNGNGAGVNAPVPEQVEALIRRADGHALGTEFLRHGALDAVAATFGVHAFVIDAARERLAATEASASA